MKKKRKKKKEQRAERKERERKGSTPMADSSPRSTGGCESRQGRA